MCFVAGTAVWTPTGTVSIENIRPGDLVLSRDPATGQQMYMPVLQTFVTHPSALYHVYYGSGLELTCTGEHPFYVVGKGHFVEAKQLVVGDALSLADGTSVFVTGLTMEEAPAGATFTTYNFEVQDFHTYFVGEGGVWVHNKSELCKGLARLYKHAIREGFTNEECLQLVKKELASRLGVTDMAKILKNQEYHDAVFEIFKSERGIMSARSMANRPSAFEELAEVRRKFQLGPIGSEVGDKPYLLSRLDIAGERPIYGMNCEDGYERVANELYQFNRHAEGNALRQAGDRGLLPGKRMKLYVEETPCEWCRGKRLDGSAMSSLQKIVDYYGIEELEVWTPQGLYKVYTPSAL